MTPAEFKAAYPTAAFAAMSDQAVQSSINKAPPHFDVSRWGDFYTEGLGLWVAWDLTLSTTDPFFGAGSSTSTRKKVGDVEIERSASFDAKAASDPYLLNHYGKRFKALARTVGAGAVTV